MKVNLHFINCLILIFGLLGCGSQSDEQGVDRKNKERAGWPIFRGSPDLTGNARGTVQENLKLIWTFKTQFEIKSSPIVGLDQVYIGSNDGYVYALDLATGTKKWSFNTEDDVEAAPLILKGRIFIGSLGGFFYALNARTGELIWQYETGGQIHGSANYAILPESNDTLILVGSYDNLMYGFEALSGKLKWTYETEYFINGSPAISGTMAAFGGCDEVIHLISILDGKKIAEVEAGAYIAGSAAILEDKAYIGHYGEKLIAVDLSTYKILWEYGERKKGAAFFSSPAVNNEVVIIGSRDRFVHCVDRKSGTKIWTFRTRDDVDSSPVICDSRVVVGSGDGRLYILNLEDGSLIWSYEIGAAITGSPAVTAGKIIVGADDGVVYAFGESE